MEMNDHFKPFLSKHLNIKIYIESRPTTLSSDHNVSGSCSNCEIMFLQLLPIHTMRLGVELDSFDGHHYISTVAPEGPVAKHGLLRPEDELLEVKKF